MSDQNCPQTSHEIQGISRDPDRSSIWNLFKILGMILRYDPPGLPGHLSWLLQKGIAILRKGRLQVEATSIWTKTLSDRSRKHTSYIAFQLVDSAFRLHRHLVRRHVRNGILSGPDPGYDSILSLEIFEILCETPLWTRTMCLHAGMGYWILANWMLFDLEGNRDFLDWRRSDQTACSIFRGKMAPAIPLTERRHLVATIEGNWALSRLWNPSEEHRRTLSPSALKWKTFLLDK